MNQKELINTLAKEHDLPKSFAEKILKTLLGTVVSRLKKGEVVRLRNFGTFQIKKSHNKYRIKFDDSDNVLKHYE